MSTRERAGWFRWAFLVASRMHIHDVGERETVIKDCKGRISENEMDVVFCVQFPSLLEKIYSSPSQYLGRSLN
jgi:hypothetical protein